MKNRKLFLIALLCTTSIFAQKKKENNMPNSTNFLDMQTEVFKDISKDSIMGGIDYSKVTNYKDMVNQAKKDLTSQEQKRYKVLYKLQKNEPNQKKKDSIKKLLQSYLPKTKTP